MTFLTPICKLFYLWIMITSILFNKFSRCTIKMFKIIFRILAKLKSCICTRKMLIVVCVIATWFAVYVPYYRQYYGECSLNMSVAILENVCKRYENKEFIGDMCEPLCTTKTLTFKKCLNARNHHKYVYLSQFLSTGVVIKVQSFEEMDEFDHHRNETQFDFYETMQWLSERFLKVTQDINKTGEFVEKMWPGGLNWNDDPETFNRTKINLKYAVHQPEYMFLRYYSHLKYTPKLYGTCGYVYVVEQTPTFDGILPWVPRYIASTWRTRVEVAWKFLNMITEMDSYPAPLYHCDMKIRNFGQNKAGEVAWLDSDMIWDRYSYDNETCEVDGDCFMTDCWVRCEDGRCVIVKHSNLRSFCRMFKGDAMYRGAPSNIRYELLETMKACNNLSLTASIDNDISMNSPENIRLRFFRLLRQGLDLDSSSII